MNEPDKAFDPHIREFLIVASKPESTDAELMDSLKFMNEFISFPLMGPFYGTLLGLADMGRIPDEFYDCIGSAVLDVLQERPAYNDFLMARWKQNHDIDLVGAMIRRTVDPDRRIAETAMWMICSVAEQDPEFLRQMQECGYSPCLDGSGALAFFRPGPGKAN